MRPGRPSARIFLLLLGNLLWAAVMAASAWVFLAHAGWQSDGAIRPVARIFFAGGALAYLPAVFAARLFVRSPRRQTRFAAHVVALAAATVAATALIFALDFRIHHAAAHSPIFTLGWFVESGFIMAAALYQFAVVGLRLYLPLGLPALFLFGLWHVKMAR